MCLGVFAVLSWSPVARAYAPMCDESAASIDAPLPAPPADVGEISALDCGLGFDIGERVLPGAPGEPTRPPAAPSDLVATLLLSMPDAEVRASSSLLRPAEQLVVAREYRRQVYRPPCVH